MKHNNYLTLNGAVFVVLLEINQLIKVDFWKLIY